jgi:hypothetical protein
MKTGTGGWQGVAERTMQQFNYTRRKIEEQLKAGRRRCIQTTATFTTQARSCKKRMRHTRVCRQIPRGSPLTAGILLFLSDSLVLPILRHQLALRTTVPVLTRDASTTGCLFVTLLSHSRKVGDFQSSDTDIKHNLYWSDKQHKHSKFIY